MNNYEAWKAEWLEKHETVEEAIQWAKENMPQWYAEQVERLIRENVRG